MEQSLTMFIHLMYHQTITSDRKTIQKKSKKKQKKKPNQQYKIIIDQISHKYTKTDHPKIALSASYYSYQ